MSGPRPLGQPLSQAPPAAELNKAIAAAQAYLLACAADDFAETRHRMDFPRRPLLLGRRQSQASDLFARATLANLLLDCVALMPGDDPQAADFRRIARGEADYLAGAKLTDRHGGWSYFPALAELPPDLDSLATVLRLFSRNAPQHLSLCEEPLQLALANIAADGAVGTWLISPRDPTRARRRMQRGVRDWWGDAVDPDVCANFYSALWRLDPVAHADPIRRGADYLIACQRPDGTWPASWYWGKAYAMSLMLGLLRALGRDSQAGERAALRLLSSQRGDGGWGEWQSLPLETALAIWVLADRAGEDNQSALQQACRCLLGQQNRQGGWRASPWIRMDTGRAAGRPGMQLSYQSRTLSCAFVLRSLLRLRMLWQR